MMLRGRNQIIQHRSRAFIDGETGVTQHKLDRFDQRQAHAPGRLVIRSHCADECVVQSINQDIDLASDVFYPRQVDGDAW